MKRLILAASAVLLATSAYAADPMIEVAAPEGFNWSGAYVGVQAGYAWGDSTAAYPLQSFQPAGTVMDPDGWLAGVYVGFNHQMANNVVLGIEGDVAYANIDGSGTYTDSFGPLPGDTDSIDVNWTAALRARAGFAMGRFMPYVAGGIAFADIDHSTVALSNPSYDGSWNDTYIGYTIGAGAEFAVTEKVILRAEYRFTDFGDETFATSNPFSEHTVDLSTHDVRFGIAVKF